MKKIYIAPEMELKSFEIADIVRTSIPNLPKDDNELPPIFIGNN